MRILVKLDSIIELSLSEVVFGASCDSFNVSAEEKTFFLYYSLGRLGGIRESGGEKLENNYY